MANQSLIADLLKTPSQIRKEREERLLTEGLAQAQLFNQGNQLGGVGGMFAGFGAAQAANVGRGMDQAVTALRDAASSATGQDFRRGEERLASEQQKVLSGTKMSNLQSLKTRRQMFVDAGAPPQALEALDRQIASLEKERKAEIVAREDRMRRISREDAADARVAAGEQRTIADRTKQDEISAAVATVSKDNKSYEQYFNEVADALEAKGFGQKAAEYRGKALQAVTPPTTNKPTKVEDVMQDGKTGTLLLYSNGTEKFFETAVAEDGDDGDTADILNSIRFRELGQQIRQARSDGDTETEMALLDEYVVLGSKAGVLNTTQQQQAIRTSAEASSQARSDMQKINESLAYIAQNPDMLTGIDASAKDLFSNILGTQDLETYYRTTVNSVVMRDIINNLPPGVASDRDVALVLKGAPPANASREVMQRYLRGMAKLNEARIARDDAFQEFMSDPLNKGNIAKFNMQYAKKQLEGRVSKLISLGYTEEQARQQAKTSRGFANAVSRKEQALPSPDDLRERAGLGG